MKTFKLNREHIPAGEDPRLVLDFIKDGVPAKLTITLNFEGDWANIFDDRDETEDDARAATAEEVFALILDEFK